MLILLLAMMSGGAHAASLVCTGQVTIRSVFTPNPLTRQATVTVVQGAHGQGQVEISAGGDPVAYAGPLFMDGSKDHVVRSAEGETTTFRMTLKSNQLRFEQTLFNAQSQVVAQVLPAVLNCR